MGGAVKSFSDEFRLAVLAVHFPAGGRAAVRAVCRKVRHFFVVLAADSGALLLLGSRALHRPGVAFHRLVYGCGDCRPDDAPDNGAAHHVSVVFLWLGRKAPIGIFLKSNPFCTF